MKSRSIHWCPNGCGRSVWYNYGIGYCCDRCKTIFKKHEIKKR